MKISYKPLWKYMIDYDIKQKDLIDNTGLSSSTIFKMKKGENVTMQVLLKICNYLNCELSNIVECVYDEKE